MQSKHISSPLHKLLTMKKLYLWAREKVHSPYALPLFAFLIFIEGILFMPVNTLLFIYGVEWPERVWTYALTAFVASVLGGMAAYGVGMALPCLGATHVLSYIFSPETLSQFGEKYSSNAAFISFFYSLLPLPYKLVTLSAGFFHVPFVPFVASIAAARFLRFFSIGLALSIWGKQLQKIIDRHFGLCVILTTVMILSILWFSI